MTDIHPLQELEALRAELAECREEMELLKRKCERLAECRRLLRKHQWDGEWVECPECGCYAGDGHAPDCPWKKAMGEA